MKFDWESFLNRYSIPFVTEGKNTRKGNISVKCPFCGYSDPSFHMGIDPKRNYFGCLRSSDHRGKKPQRLIMALTHISWDQACEMLGEEFIPEDFDLSTKRNKLLGRQEERIEKIKISEDFKRLSRSGPRGRFFRYLVERGFDPEDIPDVCREYKLRCCLQGEWNSRLILPVIHDDELIGWTGRAIGNSELRYRAHPAGTRIKEFLFNQQAVKNGGRVLVINEGPLDSMKIDFYGKDYSIRAIGTMGLIIKDEQIAKIVQLAKRFDAVGIMLDAGTLKATMQLKQRLAMIRPVKIKMLKGFSDPGEIPYTRIAEQLDLIRDAC